MGTPRSRFRNSAASESGTTSLPDLLTPAIDHANPSLSLRRPACTMLRRSMYAKSRRMRIGRLAMAPDVIEYL